MNVSRDVGGFAIRGVSGNRVLVRCGCEALVVCDFLEKGLASRKAEALGPLRQASIVKPANLR